MESFETVANLNLLIFAISETKTLAQAPFHRGINLSGWFQAENAHKIQFCKFTRKDFTEIKSLGYDVIRLPVNLHAMTSGLPDYMIDPPEREALNHLAWLYAQENLQQNYTCMGLG